MVDILTALLWSNLIVTKRVIKHVAIDANIMVKKKQKYNEKWKKKIEYVFFLLGNYFPCIKNDFTTFFSED